MRSFVLACAPVALCLLACSDDDATGSGGSPTSSATTVNPTVGSTTTSSSMSTSSTGTGGEGGAAPLDVTIQFRAVVGDEDLACETDYPGLGAEGGTTQVSDFRFYVHDVRLVTSDDTEVPVELEQDGTWQVDNVALVDFENAAGACAGGTTQTRDVITGTVPAGDYTGIRFRVGVPAELNHEDVTTSPSPLNLTALFWSWGMGHIHLSAVTSTTNGGPANQHFVHLGSTGCTGDPEQGQMVTCTTPNRPEFSFDGFNPATSVIVADLAELVAASNLATEIGCHSFPDTPACTEPFDRLGIDYATGQMTPATQVFFRVE
jgi:uncharacterized repeat protein (TIGR04052 family)